MEHGISSFFSERSQARRRVAVIAAALAGFLLATLLVTLLPPFARPVRESRFVHFGFAGPTRHVELVPVDARRGSEGDLMVLGPVIARPEPAGGSGGKPHPVRDRPTPLRSAAARTREGVGQETDIARKLAGRVDVPVIQSEEWALRRQVGPEYPLEARVLGLEGRVDVCALVDTTGTVIGTRISRSSGYPLLDDAAEKAARETLFYPYREDGVIREAVAVVRFRFSLY